MPLDQEFRHHLHELMVEVSDRLSGELSGHKQKLVWEAQKRNNSAGIPMAYSDAAEYAFRTRVEATIKSYLEALEKCGIIVDAVVERDMLQEIAPLTSGPKSLSLPPGVTGPTIGAVQAEHARKMERAGNALYREAKNRLRELKMKASRSSQATGTAPIMSQPQPFTIGSVVKTLAELKALPMEEQADLLLRRLVQLYPQVRGTGGFNKHNILLRGDTYQVAAGFSDTERMSVLNHLLGAPWTLLVNRGYLVDLNDSKFYTITEEGIAAGTEAAKPKSPPVTVRVKSAPDGAPTVFISYSWESQEHIQWVLELARRLRAAGVNVVLDQWDLHPGDDKTHFMEKSVVGSDFVLIVCTPIYKDKANDRDGGVGYEAMIITSQLAQRVKQNKFIPVLRVGEFNDSALPIWIGTKMGIDLRGDPYSDKQYELLLRTLHQANIKAPPVGPKPVFTDSGYTLPEGSLDNAVSTVLGSPRAEVESRNEPKSVQPPPVAYVIYQTKGPEAHQVNVYVRPLDAKGERFSMEPSNGESVEGTLAEIAQRYLLFDHDLRRKGYSRMTTFNGSGGQTFNLP